MIIKDALSGVNPVWLYGFIMYSLSGKASSAKMLNGMGLFLPGSGLGGGFEELWFQVPCIMCCS